MRLAKIVALGAVAVIIAAFFLAQNAYVQALVRYHLNPSATKALELASMHFNSGNSFLYDIDTAERYLKAAYLEDPETPYLNHQLARVAFLRGDFDLGLAYIDREIQLQGETSPNAYYVRGLILGYMGRYDEAADSYAIYLIHDPNNWAALNDYAWVLLKANRANEAKIAIEKGLAFFPTNPWLLNTHAIALYELGDREGALQSAEAAQSNVENLTEKEWLIAYPGNDPAVAAEGIATLEKSIAENMHSIEVETVSSTVESR